LADGTVPQDWANESAPAQYYVSARQPIGPPGGAPAYTPGAQPPQSNYNPAAYSNAAAVNPPAQMGAPPPQSQYQGYYQGAPSNNYAVAQAQVPAAAPLPAPSDLSSPAARIEALEAKVMALQAQQQQPAQRETLSGTSEGTDSTPENQGPPTGTPESTPQGYVVGNETKMLPRWDNGLIIESKNKDFIIRVGGRTQIDTNFFGASPDVRDTPIADGGVGPVNDSTQFRRARLRIEGTMWEVIGWVAEYDFANLANASNIPGNPPGFPSNLQGPPGQGPLVAVPEFTDVYMTITKMPIGNFRVGNFKEPIGLEHLTSSRWLDFMERSYNQDLFYGPFNNGFMPGTMLFNWREDERATWALWAGPNQSNLFGYHIGNDFAGTARMTFLPFYDEASQGRYLFHMGGSASIRRPDQLQDRFRARGNLRSGPPSTVNPNYLETGAFAANCQEELNGELLTIWGPWEIQAEYLGTWLQNARQDAYNTSLPPAQAALLPATSNGQTVYFQGTYVEALYFLTGESRPYDRRAGVPTRIIPNSNFFWVRTDKGTRLGMGAWQVATRYSFSDLNSFNGGGNGINGGMLNAATLGLNWFLNPNVKFQFNLDYTHRSQVAAAGPGNIKSAGVRMAMDF
jgi:phosphate-selective porin OprO/OprP